MAFVESVLIRDPNTGDIANVNSVFELLVSDTSANVSLLNIKSDTSNIYTLLGSGIGVTQITSPWVVSGTVAFSNSSIDLGAMSLAALELIGVKGADGSGIVANANPFPMSDAGGSLTIDNSFLDTALSTLNTSINTLLKPANTLAAVTSITNVVHVDDNASTLSVDDGGGILTVDGTIAFSNSSIAVTNATASNLKVAATLDAETTKVIGTVRTADGSGNLYTTNSTTYTAKFGQDANLLGSLGTAFTTAGFVDIKGADGNVFIRQATASNLNMTEASASSILTSVQLIDDMIYTDDTSTHSTGSSKGGLMMAAATPTDTAVNANDIGALAMTLNRELLVQVNTALPAGTNAIGKLSANSGIDIGDVDVTSISAGTNYIGKVRLTDGTLDSSIVDETGSSAVDALAVGGGTPHDSVDSGNPLKLGFKANNALPAAVANNDRANGISDLFGRQLVGHIDPAMQIWKSYNDTSSRAAGSAQIIWTPASGKKIAITSISIATYGTTAGRIFVFFAANADLTYSAGSDQPIFVGSFAPSTTSKPGVIICPNVPIIANTADYKLLYQNDAAISLDIVVHGYEL